MLYFSEGEKDIAIYYPGHLSCYYVGGISCLLNKAFHLCIISSLEMCKLKIYIVELSGKIVGGGLVYIICQQSNIIL